MIRPTIFDRHSPIRGCRPQPLDKHYTHALSVGETRNGQHVAVCGLTVAGTKAVLHPTCPDCQRILWAEKRMRMSK